MTYLLVLVCLLAAACENRVMQDLADLSAAPEEWDLLEDLRIGSAFDSEQALGSITGVIEDPEGRIFIVDPLTPRVWVYSQDGALHREFGRAGDGPGEFRYPALIGATNDSVWIHDARVGGLSVFQADGTFTESYSFIALDDGIRAIPTALLADGSLLFEPMGSMEVMPAKPRPVLRANRAGEVIDTMWHISTSEPMVIDDVLAEGTKRVRLQPFVIGDTMAVSPGGERVIKIEGTPTVENGIGSLRMWMWTAAPEAAVERTFAFTPTPITEADIDRKVDDDVDLMKAWAEGNANLPPVQWSEYERAFREALDVPASFPPVTQALVADVGTVWLRRENRGGELSEWIVIQSDVPVARLEVPTEVKLLAVYEDFVWGVIRDDLDVPYAVRYRILRHGGSLL